MNENANKSSTSPFVKNLVEQIELIVIVFAAIILLFSFCFRTCQVAGPSMENTLYNRETVVISDLFYTPKRNDIIVFHQTSDNERYNEPIVKRVIGVPGDSIEINYTSTTMIVTVTDPEGNVEVLKEDYIKYEGHPIYRDTVSPLNVEEGKVFVMGDNRNNSADSRSAYIGQVDTRRILGKVMFRVTPLSRFGAVN